MSDAPERIWINKVHGQHPGDWDFTDGKHLTKAQLRQKVEYIRADRIEALTEQLEAARADAKEAEDYAEELEKQLNICRMAQVVMENGIAEAEKERDRWKDRCRFLSGELDVVLASRADEYDRAEAAEANLAVVEAAYRLEAMRRDDYSHEGFDHHLAELKGTTNDQG